MHIQATPGSPPAKRPNSVPPLGCGLISALSPAQRVTHAHTHYTMTTCWAPHSLLHSIPASGPSPKKGSDITARWKPPSGDIPAKKQYSFG